MSDIALTSAMRRNLLSLQNTSKLMDMTSDRLSTGRKVNSALDNPSSFFTARGLTNRAGDLSSLLDAMGQGLQTLKAAEQGIESITDLVSQAKAVADEAYEAAAAADKGALQEITDSADGEFTISLTAATDVVGGGTTLGTLVFQNDAGSSVTYTAATGDTVQEIADFVNNNVTGMTASFNDTTGYLEFSVTSGASVAVSSSAAFDATASITAGTFADTYVNLASESQLMRDPTASATITITTDDGTKTYTASSASTVADFVDWINSEVGGVTASVSGSGIEFESTGGFTMEGLNSTILDDVDTTDNNVDGHQAGRTLTFAVKGSDTFTAIANGETIEFDGVAISVGAITTGAELLDNLKKGLGSDWDVGEDSEGYVTVTYVGSSTSPVGYTADSQSGSLLLNDGTVTSTSSFVGTFNVSGSVDNDGLVEQFNDLLAQIDSAQSDASYKGINLLNGSNLTVNFNEDRTSSLTIEGVTFDSSGLGFSTASGWNSTSDIQTTLDQVSSAVDTLRAQSAKFGREGAVIQTRQDFTENMINTLQEGADSLTLADMNEEGANMLALQTRQQLATSSLSMASQASQAVLSLFR